MPGDFDLVKERVDLVQLVEEHGVKLRRTGRAYVGLCPFHNEKTPSFNVDPERRTYKCFGCLPPGSLIKAETGPRPIEQIAIGDSVYAGDGRLHRVLQTYEHDFAGELVQLVCAPFKVPILLTPDHKVPVLRPRSKRPEQIEAGAIKQQNYLLYPAIQRTSVPLDWKAIPGSVHNRGTHPRPLPTNVDLWAFAEWLGWYLAEGSVSNDRVVRFSLSADETTIGVRLMLLTRELFGKRCGFSDLRPKRNSLELWFSHALLARWLKHNCGENARSKRLPAFVWSWIPEMQWTMFKALLSGDASFYAGKVLPNGRVGRGSWRLELAAPALIDDVRDLLISNGVIPSLTRSVTDDGRKSWSIRVPEDIEGRWAEAPRPLGPIPVRVRRIARVPYSGPVYNLTVEDEHTYLTLSGTVCNCGEGGDAFTFLEKQDGLTPSEALHVLAERAGVELTRRAPEEREAEKRLLSAHETAHFYFRQALRITPQGKAVADEYLAGRGIRPETIEKFGLGYAPDIRDGLLLYLRKKGFTDQEAVASGLVISHERGLFDRFRHRVMIPIRDGRGRIIAFAGRALRTDQPAKYMNSPQTEIFDKSATLFALDLAKARIRRENEAVIVEGQLDAISAHQAGFDNVVASMGTALTERQYWILSDLKIEKAVVTFDGDAPGQASAERRGRELAAVVQRATRVDRAGRGTVAGRGSTNVSVAVLPEGTDPDDLARRDPTELRARIDAAEPVLAFVIEQIRKRSDLVSPDGRRRFLAETLPILADEPDQLTRELYLGTLARLTGVSEESLREQVASRPRAPGGGDAMRAAPATPTVPAPADREWDLVAERYLMAQLTRFPEEAARLDLDPMELLEPDHRAVFELLRAGERPGPRFPAHLAAVVAALAASEPPPTDEGDVARAISMAVMRVREKNLRRRMGAVQAELRRGTGDVGQLMDELTTLMDDLTRLMGTRERDTVLREAPENEDE